MEAYFGIANSSRFEVAGEIFKQLENPMRLRIFWLLCHCEICVSELALALNASSPAVSHHLRALRKCGLIKNARRGREVYYRASDTSAAQALHLMVEQVIEIACPS